MYNLDSPLALLYNCTPSKKVNLPPYLLVMSWYNGAAMGKADLSHKAFNWEISLNSIITCVLFIFSIPFSSRSTSCFQASRQGASPRHPHQEPRPGQQQDPGPSPLGTKTEGPQTQVSRSD